MNKLAFGASLTTILLGSTAMADCAIDAGSVRILSNDFPAMHVIAAKAEECASDNVTVSVNQTTEHRNLQVAALTGNPAEYTTAVVANGSIVPLLNEGLIQPLDDLVAAHGANLAPNQLITIDGQIMAVAFMANAQHLFYREDILAEAGVEVPSSYEDMLAAAEAIKAAGLMDYPIAGTYKAGWNLAEEFVNMYMGFGQPFFAEGSAEPAIANESGVAALAMMKSVTSFMNPDFLTHDSNSVQAEWEAGNVAMTVLWGSRAGAIMDDEGSTPEIVAATGLAAAPTVGGNSVPATTLWWDGFTIAKNVSDEDAEATFIAMSHGLTAEMANDNVDAATWLIEGFNPGESSQGVFATATAGAKPYPMQPYMGLMHSALGAEIVEFLQGQESAEQALADVEAAYRASAKEAGFL